MGLTLSHQPGYADVDPSVFVSGQPALGIHVSHLSDNAAFGVVRMEVFEGFYENGQTVALPVSPIDGYAYKRSELIYMWNVHYTFKDSTGWATGPGPLWFMAWKVDQTTGLVSCLEDYRTSNFPPKTGDTTEGNLRVFTIAQRGLTDLVISGGAPAYQDVSDTAFATDKACNQTLMQSLNTNAKYGCVKCEAFYLGEYKNGDTVTLPTSPADGYTYRASECTFMFSWRWTTVGAAPFQIPDILNLENFNDLTCSISAAGVVSCSIDWEKAGANVNRTDYGRVAVFAFCRRATLSATSGIPDLTVDTSGWSGPQTAAWLIKGAAISGTSSVGALKFQASSTGFFTITSACIYKTAAGGTTVLEKVVLTHGGATSWVVPAGGTVETDEFAMTIDSSHDYYIEVYRGTSSTGEKGYATGWPLTGNILSGWPGVVGDGTTVGVGGTVPTFTPTNAWIGLAALLRSSSVSPPSGGGSFPAFTELDPNLFMPGQPLTATELKDINTDTKVAILTPEFFGPTDYANGSTVALPVSPIDGYAYARTELHYVYELRTTKPATNIRMYTWLVLVNKDTGLVTINTARCESGGGAIFSHDGVVSVLVIAQRSRQANTIADTAAVSEPPALPSPDGLASSRLKANGV